MPIAENRTIIVVEHSGEGTLEAAEQLCKQLHQAVIRVAKAHGRVAVLHDSTGLHGVTEGYARTFAKCFAEVKIYNPVQVAGIERSWLRVFAKLAMTLSGTDMQIFANNADCVAYLRTRGFETTGLTIA